MSFELTQRITNMVLKYRPEKVELLDKLLQAHAGKENDLLKSLITNYGPEPTPNEVASLRQMAPTLPRGGGLDFSQKGPDVPSTPSNRALNVSGMSTCATSPRHSIPSAVDFQPQQRLSHRERLLNMYRFYNPKNTCNVERLLVMCAGKEEALIRSLVQKYGPEPTPNMIRALQEASGVHSRSRGDYRARLANMYMKYNRKKLETLDQDLLMYRGKEDQLFTVLTRLYGPEPSDEEMLFVRRQHAHASNYGQRISAIFAKHCPERLSEVASLLKTYAGHEDALIRELVVRYGAEPSSEEANVLIERVRMTRIETSNSSTSVASSQVMGGNSWALLDNRTKLIVFYTKYNQSIVPHVDSILCSCPGQEKKLFADLVAKYGPVPTDEEIVIIQNALAEKERRTKRLLVSMSFRERLYIFYMKHAPDKLCKVEGILKQYMGREQQCIHDMVARYGPEPSEHEISSLQRQAILYMNQVDARQSNQTQTQTLLIQRPVHQEHTYISVPQPTQKPSVQIPHVSSPPTRDYRTDLIRYYQVHEPHHLSRVDEVLLQFRGKEEQLMEILFEKYGVVPNEGSCVQTVTVSKRTISAEQATRYRERILRFYRTYDPSKESSVDAVMAEYAGREDELMMSLLARYGPEPSVVEQVSISIQSNAVSTTTVSTNHDVYYDRIVRMYRAYDPDMLPEVKNIMSHFAGREDELLTRLCARYGPEPSVESDTKKCSFADVPQQVNCVDYRTRLIYMLMFYDPEKVCHVDKYLVQFAGEEKEMMAMFVQLYGPEPTPLEVARSVYQQHKQQNTGLEVVDEKQALDQTMTAFAMKYDPELLVTLESMFAQFSGKLDILVQQKTTVETVVTETTKVEKTSTVVCKDLVQRVANFFLMYDESRLGTEKQIALEYSGGDGEKLIRTLILKYGREPTEEDIMNAMKKRRLQFSWRIMKMYRYYDAQNVSHAESLIRHSEGKEEETLRALVLKYGPEPTDDDLAKREMGKRTMEEYRVRVRRYFEFYDSRRVGQEVQLLETYTSDYEELMRVLLLQYGAEPTEEQAALKKFSTVTETKTTTCIDLCTRLKNFYSVYDPQLLGSIEHLASNYSNRDEELMKALISKYGPEPDINQVQHAQTLNARQTTLTFEQRVHVLLLKYEPSRAVSFDSLKSSYSGKEQLLLSELTRKYGPEPSDDEAQALLASISKSTCSRAFRSRVVDFLCYYDPQRLNSVDEIVELYAESEEECMAELCARYGPEPLGSFRPCAMLDSGYV